MKFGGDGTGTVEIFTGIAVRELLGKIWQVCLSLNR
jgi:hypothetical protein